MAQKLWRVSQILNCSPFDPGLLKHNVAQIDFIIEMWCADDPSRGRLERHGQEPAGVEASQAKAAWTNRLRGRALDEFLGRMRPSAAVMARLRRYVKPAMRRQRRRDGGARD